MSNEEKVYVQQQFCIIKLKMEFLANDIKKLSQAVENLALQTTNNQVENRKALDAIRTGILDTNLAVKYPNK